MTFIHALILGLVEGITEFLPISSTAHLVLTTQALHLTETEFVKSFIIFIQLGAILAVVVLYARTLTLSQEIWKRIIIAFIPTGIIGFILYKLIKQYFLGNTSLIIWTLGLGGIVLILFEYFYAAGDSDRPALKELESMPYSTALIIGVAQSLAVIPGVSRSAATIITGRALGLGRKAIVEFSFLLAIPTMLAATGYDLLKSGSVLSGEHIGLLLIGFVTAFVSALIAIKVLLRYIQTHSFTLFGVYRVIVALILLFFV
jgi:undecaprenyl-diphosphatase